MTASGSGQRITREFADTWSARYATDYDHQVLKVIGPAVAERDFYTRDEFLAVCRWKTRRTTRSVATNTAEDVQDLTETALAAPERLRHRILALLAGVRTPTASALLMVADPKQFTVIDYRSVEALQAHGELGPGWPGYVDYLERCRAIAHAVGTDLRQLDRALWCWHKFRPRS
ncbi:hypothetical protein [Blastococcus sp. SYSU DS0541]